MIIIISQLYKPFQHWSAEGTVWVYSDPHFNDSDCQKIDQNWISSEDQIAKINSKVGKKDTLIILGDIGDKECVKKLKGYKVLICGNHDHGGSYYEDVFDEIYTEPIIVGPKIILSHEPLDIDWCFNIHGHTHSLKSDTLCHKCVCSNVIDYIPINLNQFVKSGRLNEVKSIHRSTIDTATKRSAKKKRKTN